MTDYRTKASFAVALTPEQADWASRVLKGCQDWLRSGLLHGGDHSHAAIPDDIADAVSTIVSNMDDQELALNVRYGDGCLHVWEEMDFDYDFVARWLRVVLQHFNLDKPWSFDWSYDCSSPKHDGYGGGACVLNRHEIDRFETTSWLHDATLAMETRLKARQLCESGRYGERELDDFVHDFASSAASSVNNAGVLEQLTWLMARGWEPPTT